LGDESGSGLTGFLSRLGSRRALESSPATPTIESAPPPGDAPAQPTKALRKFLRTFEAQEAPVLLDLGPVIGPNLTFFGETLGCKVFIEDLYTDIEQHIRSGITADLPTFLESRLTQPAGSIDGILAWDLFDYLEAPAAQVLATQLSRIMKVNGALLAFFSAAVQPADLRYTKFVIADEQTLRHRTYPASRGRQRVLQNRDIIRMFETLRVSDSFLLQTNLREILFRKPAYLTPDSLGI
jgi:hypothetical protein